MPNGVLRRYKTKPRYGHVTAAKRGAQRVYMATSTRKYGNIKIHQAVCEAFHGPKPFEEAVVIHKDECGTNNRADNLKWGSQKENLNAPGFLTYCRGRIGEDSTWYKHKNG